MLARLLTPLVDVFRAVAWWLAQCARRALGIRSPSLGTVCPWPWDKGPHEIDIEGVMDIARHGR